MDTGQKRIAYQQIVANVARPHRFLRKGSRVVVITANRDNACERVWVRGMSRRGRRVFAWVDARYLQNARIVAASDDANEAILPDYFGKDDAELEKIVDLLKSREGAAVTTNPRSRPG